MPSGNLPENTAAPARQATRPSPSHRALQGPSCPQSPKSHRRGNSSRKRGRYRSRPGRQSRSREETQGRVRDSAGAGCPAAVEPRIAPSADPRTSQLTDPHHSAPRRIGDNGADWIAPLPSRHRRTIMGVTPAPVSGAMEHVKRPRSVRVIFPFLITHSYKSTRTDIHAYTR